MIYIRGNPLDYDEWRDDGCTGWGWDDVLPYFKRAEDNERGAERVPRRRRPAARHRRALAQPALRTPSSRPPRRAGSPRNDDFNGARAGRRRLLPAHPARRARARAPPSPTCTRRSAARTSPSGPTRTCCKVLFDGHARRRASRRARRGEALELARRARGDRVRRRLQLAAAADAVGHRPARGARAARRSRGRRAREVGDEPAGPPHRGRDLFCQDEVSLEDALNEANVAASMQGHGPLTSNIAEAGGFARTRDGAPRARRPVPHGARGRSRARASCRRPSTASRCRPACSSRSRRGEVAARLARPGGEAVHRPQLLRRARRRARGCVAGLRLMHGDRAAPAPLRDCAETPDMAPAGDSDDATSRAHVARRPARRLPPGRHLPDGRRRRRGRRPRAARARRRGPARRRRLGDAERPARQHQRADDHDRRAGRRPDPRAPEVASGVADTVPIG